MVEFAHAFRADEGRFPTADDIACCLNDGEMGTPEEQGATIISGFADGTIYTLKSVADYYDIDVNELLDAEISLVSRLGWRVSLNATAKKKWLSS